MPAGVSAYVPLANVTLSSSASEVNFTSISQSYRDLVLVINASVLSGTPIVLLGVNGSSATINWVAMSANGSSNLSQTADWTNLYTTYGYSNMATTPSIVTINAMDYTATDKHKSFLVRSSSPANSTAALAARQASTSAINSFRVFLNSSSFAAGSTFALYGVSA